MAELSKVIPEVALSEQRADAVQPWLVPIAVLAAVLWSYWATVGGLVREWQADDNYSVGQLVPLAAVYLVWQERRALAACRWGSCWWGLAILAVAAAARAFGLLFMYESAERYSLVLTAIGLVLLVAGRQAFWQSRWILLFLFLMVPLPGRVHNFISGPLQRLATSGAVFCLELLGVTVAREGNVIVLNDRVPVAVAEACSGLRMLTAFVVVASVLAYIVNRPRWQKVVLLCSSVAVAILCNLIRLVVTAGLFLYSSSAAAERFFHDFAGWTMMPVAILLLLGELWIMAQLVVDEPGESQSCEH